MKTNLEEANLKALEIYEAYTKIKVGDLTLTTPYFINVVENIYKDLFKQENVDPEKVKVFFGKIAKGETPICPHRGKGTPAQIQESLHRLLVYLGHSNYANFILTPDQILAFMKIYHIGVDCSGFVYNILEYSLPSQIWEQQKALLYWGDPEKMQVSRAGVFVFNSTKLETVENIKDLQPLDLIVWKNNSHMSIIVSIDGVLVVAESALVRGVSTFEVEKLVKKHSNEFTIKRLTRFAN